MRSLWDVEKEKAAEEEKRQKLYKLLGRDFDIPKELKHKSMTTSACLPVEVLKISGYKDIGRGWIKNINKKERYHAYFYDRMIYLHKDVIINHKHHATTEKVYLELERMKKYVISKKKGSMLNREDRLKALANLTNPIIQSQTANCG